MKRARGTNEERLLQRGLELGVDGADVDAARLQEGEGAQVGQQREEGETLTVGERACRDGHLLHDRKGVGGTGRGAGGGEEEREQRANRVRGLEVTAHGSEDLMQNLDDEGGAQQLPGAAVRTDGLQ